MMLRTLALLLICIACASAQVCLWCCVHSKAGQPSSCMESDSQHNGLPLTAPALVFVGQQQRDRRLGGSCCLHPAPPHTNVRSSPHPARPRHTRTQVSQVKLPYNLKDIAPTIDAQTMEFHYATHYKAYVDNLNKALGTAPASVKSSDLTSKGSLHGGGQMPLHSSRSGRAGAALTLSCADRDMCVCATRKRVR